MQQRLRHHALYPNRSAHTDPNHADYVADHAAHDAADGVADGVDLDWIREARQHEERLEDLSDIYPTMDRSGHRDLYGAELREGRRKILVMSLLTLAFGAGLVLAIVNGTTCWLWVLVGALVVSSLFGILDGRDTVREARERLDKLRA